MAHVAPYKKQLVETLATRCAQARVVGIANIHGIPAPQFQDIRKKLSGRATITVAKNNLLRLALQQASEKKPALVQLSETIQGQTAVGTRSPSTTRSSVDRSPKLGGRLSHWPSGSRTRRRKRFARSSQRPTRKPSGSRWNPNSRRKSRSNYSWRKLTLRCSPLWHARP